MKKEIDSAGNEYSDEGKIMHINAKLQKLYESKWAGLMENGPLITGITPTNPLLLGFDENKFSQADIRILICGQETTGWDGFGNSIAESMKLYLAFSGGGTFDPAAMRPSSYPGYGISAFWKAFRFFQEQFDEIFKGKNIQYIWQNISKIGRADGDTGVTNEIRNLEREYFPVLKEEVALLKPDVVLFLTGPDRDHDVLFHFPDAKFTQAGEEQNLRSRAWVAAAELPQRALRLYHPAYFREWTDEYKAQAVSLIKAKGE